MPNPAVIALLLAATTAHAQGVSSADRTPVAWWPLDDVAERGSSDRASGVSDRVEGNYRLVDGVVGKAVSFDGYTTVLRRAAAGAPELADSFTIEAWVAVGAYPWNWVPIVDHGDEQMRGFVFGLGPRGELSLRVAADGRWLEAISPDGAVALRRWSHLAARYDAATGLALFVDGRIVGQHAAPDPAALGARNTRRGRVIPARGLDLLVGGVRAPLRPTPWHRYEGTRPSWYSLDGVLDELKIYAVARSDAEVAQAAAAVTPGPPPLEPRVFPSGPRGPGRFGAYFAKLRYYPEWDALWRVGPDPDVVVRFDSSPVRVVFWRGTQYSPAWVTDNGLWMADQSVEGYDQEFTYEHMNDKQNRYSHVRIIEQSDARVVVHWRYALVNVKNEIWNTEERSGNGAWVDEYYYFYPDATGVRKVSWNRDTLGSPIQYQESIPLTEPGQLQGDVVNPDYVTVGNLAGETRSFSYVEDPKPDGKPVPADLVVQMHNLKSRYKPFIVFEPGNRMEYLRDMNLANLSRPGSGNHWPVAQILSDGRTSLAADHAGHFLGFPISEPPQNRGPDGRDYRCSLYGMTDRPFSELVELARSWSSAPGLRVVGGGFTSLGFDRSERVYRVARSTPAARDLELSLAASPASPLRNLAVVVENWGEPGASLTLDGRAVPRGAAFRLGHHRSLESTDLVLWIETRGEAPIRIRLSPER